MGQPFLGVADFGDVAADPAEAFEAAGGINDRVTGDRNPARAASGGELHFESAERLLLEQHAAKLGMPMSGEDAKAIAIASDLIRETGFEPVLVGGLDMGNYLVPDTPLAGQHTPDEIRKIVATLKK